MKYVTFVDRADKNYACAAAVAAWSIRSHGGLPSSTEYILYTTDPENYTNPLLQKAFNAVLAPPFDMEKLASINWDERPVRQMRSEFDKEHRKTQMFWTKFLSFLETPCDGDAVMYTDFDMLCVDTVCSAIPSRNKTWSAVRWSNRSCNNGLLVKTPKFDASGGVVKMQEPLWDLKAYNIGYKIWPWDDEIGPAWYFYRYGRSDFYDLPLKFNRSIRGLRNSNEKLGDTDLRFIHYVHTYKPWTVENTVHDEYTQRWLDTKTRMLKVLKMEDYE